MAKLYNYIANLLTTYCFIDNIVFLGNGEQKLNEGVENIVQRFVSVEPVIVKINYVHSIVIHYSMYI